MFDDRSLLRGASAALDLLSNLQKVALLLSAAFVAAVCWSYLRIDESLHVARFAYVAPLGSLVLLVIFQGRMRGIVTDLSARVEALSRVESAPGLLACQAFLTIAERLRSIALRQGRSLGVLTLNIEYFEDLRRVHGVEAARNILAGFTDMVLSCVRTNSDLVCQMRESEFVILLIDADASHLDVVAGRLQRAFRKCACDDVVVTVRLGGAILHHQDANIFTTIHRSEAAGVPYRSIETASEETWKIARVAAPYEAA